MDDRTVEADALAREAVPDSVRAQILATEHWSLLATRSMLWNELFTRTGMYLTVLSAAVVALALVAQATDFGDNFRIFALLVLPVVFFIGLATHVRLFAAGFEENLALIGMNRLRHAYLSIAPDLEPYFITGYHDDVASWMRSATMGRPSTQWMEMLSTAGLIVVVVNSVVAGVIGALVAASLGATLGASVAIGVIPGVGFFVLVIAVVVRLFNRAVNSHQPRFPGPATDRSGA